MPAQWSQRKMDLCEFEASLVYNASSKTARTTETVSKHKTKTPKQTKQNKKKKRT